ncbi:MAG TPA: PEGA domain-containing protein, partial [Myxococcota bacterium]|nr:PEGA domain-containing protein [Myxococcota bacterium]
MKGSVSRRKPSLALNVVAVVVAINVAGAAVYVLTRHKAQESAGGSDTPAREGEPTGDVSRALRAAGLAALESGRYEEAVKRFTEAAKSSKASADLPQLMKIAMELRDRSSTSPAKGTVTTTDMAAAAPADKADEAKAEEAKPEEDKPEDKPTVASNTREDAKSAAKRREREREAAAREREREKARRVAQASARTTSKPEPADVETSTTASPGTIIVSSTPSGLTVQLDGKVMDQTPLRLTAEPGSHEIALLHNSTVVFSRRLNVVSSSVQSLDPDVSAQVALLTPSRQDPPATMASAQSSQASAKEPASAGLTTPKENDKPADQRGNTGDTSERPRQDLEPGALYAIANASVGLSSVSAEQLADVYFGRSNTLNGRKVEPILRSPSGGAGAAFFRSVLHTTT